MRSALDNRVLSLPVADVSTMKLPARTLKEEALFLPHQPCDTRITSSVRQAPLLISL